LKSVDARRQINGKRPIFVDFGHNARVNMKSDSNRLTFGTIHFYLAIGTVSAIRFVNMPEPESKKFYSPVIEAVASMFGDSESLIPPRRLIDGVGGGDFQKVGREFFKYFTEIGQVKPHQRILDVGCGCGRMAVPMIPFLSGEGAYYGFDIVRDAIKWASKHITSKYPRFHFELADIYNKVYNEGGKIAPLEFRFPYEDVFFDFTILTSVFTHMLADDMEHYLSEISRTLKPGGRCMISFFILNAEAVANLGKGGSKVDFNHSRPHCKIWKPESPEAAVAYEEDFLRECFAKYKISIVEPIYFGSWSGREKLLSYQDIILGVKD
jgi:SAM-dependent methyltransferase